MLPVSLYHNIPHENNESKEPTSVHCSIDWNDFWNYHVTPTIPRKLNAKMPIRIGIHKVSRNSTQMMFLERAFIEFRKSHPILSARLQITVYTNDDIHDTKNKYGVLYKRRVEYGFVEFLNDISTQHDCILLLSHVHQGLTVRPCGTGDPSNSIIQILYYSILYQCRWYTVYEIRNQLVFFSSNSMPYH